MALSDQFLVPAQHHLMLIDYLQRLARGDINRLMVFMPPGHGKTVYLSKLFPCWWFKYHPQSSVLGISNTTDFAEQVGRQVRNHVAENHEWLGYNLSRDSRAAAKWSTDKGGDYFAAGVTTAILGRRADLAIIDDPFRSRQEVENVEQRNRLWEWFQAQVIGRMKGMGRIVVMHTRFHEDDLAGRLLRHAEAGGTPWTVLNLPAIAEPGDMMGRAPGQPLWPEVYPLEVLASKRVDVGPREWDSQYQQDPRPRDGGLFKTSAIRFLDEVPQRFLKVVRAWDLAATEKIGSSNPDWTVGLKLGVLPDDGGFVVLDVQRIQGSPHAVHTLIQTTAQRDGRSVLISIPQDPGQAGKSQVQFLGSKLAGFPLHASPETGSKETRAAPVAGQMETGNVAFMRAAWNDALIYELEGFPAGRNDDQVDALARAFNRAIEAPAPSRVVRVNHMGR